MHTPEIPNDNEFVKSGLTGKVSERYYVSPKPPPGLFSGQETVIPAVTDPKDGR